jgi:hypothetical protein
MKEFNNYENLKTTRFTWKKFFLNLFLSLTLFHTDIYFNTMALASDLIPVQEKQELAKENAQENKNHENSTLMADTTTSCIKSNSSAIDREIAEDQIRDNLVAQSFDEISQVFADVESSRQSLDAKTGHLANTVSGIGLVAPGQGVNLDEKKELEEEYEMLKRAVPASTAKVASLRSRLDECDRTDEDSGPRTRCSEYASILAQLRVAIATENDLKLREMTIRARLWKKTVHDGKAVVADADVAVDVSHVASTSVENNYNRLLELIKAQEGRLEAAMQNADRRLADVEFQEKHNAEFEIYQAAMEDFDPDTESGKRALSNIEMLSMASAALQLLSCKDISDIKTRSYPLLKVASANFVASTINDTQNYTDATKNCIMACESITNIKEDQKNGSLLYPQFKKKDLTNVVSNCKAAGGVDGLFLNDANADDDKNEQIKSIERAANLHNELVSATELMIANRENAINMFQTAHAAAMMELTTKTSRVAAAEGELAQARAWKAKAMKSILIYIGVLAALRAANSGCWGCLSSHVAAAAITLLFHRRDKAKAEAKIAKWEKKLQEARIHGMMACNYPGEGAGLEAMERASSIPRIFKKSIIDGLVTAEVTSPLDKKQYYVRSLKESDFIKGNKIKEFSMKMTSSFANILFPNLMATSTTDSLGIHSQSASFRYYMQMRLGAWKLLTFNAAKLVDLRQTMVSIDHLHPVLPVGTSIKQAMARNTTQFAGKTIEKTGFALPETRVVLLAAIVEMMNGNMGTLNDSLIAVTRIRDSYVSWLDRVRDAAGLGTTGTEDDEAEKETRNGVCMTSESSGIFSLDASCECSKSGSCATFKGPQFSSFTPGSMKSAASIATDQANANMNGNIEGANVAAGKLKDESSAVGKIIKDEENKLNKIRKANGLPPKNISDEGKLLSASSSNKLNSDISKSNPELSALAQAALNSSKDYSSDHEDKNRENEAKKRAEAANKANQKTYSLASKKGSKSTSTGNANGGGNFGLDDMKIGDGDGDMDYRVDSEMNQAVDKNISRDENAYKKHERVLSKNNNSSGSYEDGKYSQGISKDRDGSLFKLISKRYKKSASKYLR